MSTRDASSRPRIDSIDWSGARRRLIPVDGADLAAWHVPGPGDRWVVWLHGTSANHLTWGYQLDAFPDAQHVFLDVRGQGESTMHAGRRVDFEAAVDDIGHVLDSFAAERAVLVGHSWGGNPVQEFGFRHPERTSGVVMIGTWGQIRPMTPGEFRRIRLMTKAYRAVPWRLVAWLNSRLCTDDPQTRDLIEGMLLATGRDVFLDLGLTAYERVHDVDRFPTPTPTLLLRGSLDAPKYLEPIYRDLCSKNPGARHVVIEGTKHVPMVDTPDEFNRAVGTFLHEVWNRSPEDPID